MHGKAEQSGTLGVIMEGVQAKPVKQAIVVITNRVLAFFSPEE
jgi:hypothetical protein